MSILQKDICVMGGGSAGLSFAAGAAQMGASVVLVEKGSMGGDCLNYGCVPSKALLAAGHVAHTMKEAPLFGLKQAKPVVDFSQVNQHVQEVINAIAPHDSVERFEGLGVEVIKAKASFLDEKTISAGEQKITAKYFVIATGSHAYVPPIEGLDALPYLTNETLFNLKESPEHLVILGGGPIGIEMAQAFSRLGSKVTVMQSHRILPKDDPELVEVIRQKLLKEGVTLLEGTRATAASTKSDGVALHYTQRASETSDVLEKSIEGSHLLVAAGRRPSVSSLNLEAAGVAFSDQGIQVDDRLRTSQKHIYALGDAIGQYQFTHMASYHAGIAIRNILFKVPAKVSSQTVPWVTYTDPELAHIGLSEDEARKSLGDSLQILTFPFAENDRAQTERATEGLIKVFASKKGRVLGASLVGKQAGEMILPWSLAISKKMKLSDMAGAIVPYPTLNEVSKRVAGHFYTPILYGPKTKLFVRLLMKWFS